MDDDRKKSILWIDLEVILKELATDGLLNPEVIPILKLLSADLNAFLNKPAAMVRSLKNMLYDCDNQKREYVKNWVE